MEKEHILFYRNFILILFSFSLFLFFGCNFNKTSENEKLFEVKKENIKSDTLEKLIAVEAPPLTDGIFPCSECHADPELVTNDERRELMMHDEIDAIFSHDEENRWCLDCHNADNRDSLRLASGKLIGFDESYKLCGQCHGDKLRDWKVGVHGKRTGEWNGKKQYLLCVHCHNPHSPKFAQLTPEPPPIDQDSISK